MTLAYVQIYVFLDFYAEAFAEVGHCRASTAVTTTGLQVPLASECAIVGPASVFQDAELPFLPRWICWAVLKCDFAIAGQALSFRPSPGSLLQRSILDERCSAASYAHLHLF